LGPASALSALAAGVLLVALGALGLRHGVVAASRRWPRFGAVAAAVALAAPSIAFAAWAARRGLAGAALGAVAGGFAGVAFTSAVVAWSAALARPRRASTLAACALLAAAAVGITAFDGRVTMPEGRLMLLAALAILLAAWRARPEGPVNGAESAGRGAPLGLLIALAGAGVLAFGAWLAVAQIAPLAGRRADGDLELGLTALGVGAALPSLAVALRAARRGEGGPALVEVTTAAAVGLAAGLGTAALIMPLSITEAFLGAPLAGLALAAAAFLALAAAPPRPVRGLKVMGGLVYVGLLAVFARSAG
jgi:cation:H+ antiporter